MRPYSVIVREAFHEEMDMGSLDNRWIRYATALLVLGAGACAPYDRAPHQVEASNPTVTYKYHDDDDLIQANQMAANFCQRYRGVPQPAQFATDRDGDRVVVFECIASSHGSPGERYSRSDMTYTYRTDQELMDASRDAQAYCMRNGNGTVNSNIVRNGDGTKTVTFQCRRT
jgi:hypothetical protein